MLGQNRHTLLHYFSNEFFGQLESFCRRGPAHYRTAWEIKGGFDIFSKATDILIHKKPEVLSLPTAGLAEFHNYFWAVLHNLLRNLTRNKEVRLAHEIQYKTIPLTEGSFNLIESPGADTQSPDNLSKTDQIIIQITSLNESLYHCLQYEDIRGCENLIRYFRKVIDSIDHYELKLFATSNFHLFFAIYYFDAGKLNLSRKHAIESIRLYDLSHAFLSHEFIAGAYNTLALIALNQQDYTLGQEIFSQNILRLEKVNRVKPENGLILTKTRMLFGMFSGNITAINGEKVFGDSLEMELPPSEILFKYYVETYLLIDRNKPEKAEESLSGIHREEKLIKSSPTLSKIRYYIIQAEQVAKNFSSPSFQEREKILYWCELAEIENRKVQNNYFNGLIDILGGFARNEASLKSRGLGKLKTAGYLHYFNWYKKKFQKP